jgi:aquaporin TIP
LHILMEVLIRLLKRNRPEAQNQDTLLSIRIDRNDPSVKDLSSAPSLGKRVVAELVGTYMFVFVGAGSAVGFIAFGNSDPAVALLIAALGNGVGLGVSISATMGVSGGALNPAVAIGLLIGRKLPAKDVVPYILAELVGAILAGFSLVAVVPKSYGDPVYWGAPPHSLVQGQSVLAAIALEAIMTFFLVFVVYGTIVDERAPKLGGLAVGLIVATDVFIGGPLTGAAMNPARAMGPMITAAIVTNLNAFNLWYVYWIGPIIGGAIAALVYAYGLFSKHP